MNVIHLSETESTNTYVSANAGALEPWTIVEASCQTGGRGQRGNSWESEAGKNLTFSVFMRPADFPARDQFAISEAVALAVVEALADYGIEARVKWPNDIYVGDRKICGILIEHVVTGMNITHTVAGVGLNVNQTEFRSDAPNPVSMSNITGHEFDLQDLLGTLGKKIRAYCERSFMPEERLPLHSMFRNTLWRGDGGFYPFSHPGSRRFEARIADIEPGGMLVLESRDGEYARYAFKEVVFELAPESGTAVRNADQMYVRKDV